ncbi:MAG: hypothetical protein WAW39_28930 [Prosthecobacter sp.]
MKPPAPDFLRVLVELLLLLLLLFALLGWLGMTDPVPANFKP